MSNVTTRIGRAALLSSAATLLASSFAGVAIAQQQQEMTIEEVVVTGSRIARPNLESASPVLVVNAEEIKATGVTRTEDLINNLPSVFAGQGGNLANGASGTATVDLRGLGAARTLVLVNGRRLLPGDPSSPYADLNTIPAALVQRVDVLSGGASATYGADAVAGVVNFVMDDKFEGFKVDGQYSFYQHNNGHTSLQTALDASSYPYPKGSVSDGGTWDTTVMFGTGTEDGKGHLTAYVGYRKINAVMQGNRDYSACAVTGNEVDGFTCLGSGGSATGTFGGMKSLVTENKNGKLLPSAKWALGGVPGQTVDGDQFRTATGADTYNFAPYNYFQRPDTRYTAGFFAHYDVSDAFKPYAEFNFMDDHTVAQIAASGTFNFPTTINCDNPMLSAQQMAMACVDGNYVGNKLVPTYAADGTTILSQVLNPATDFVDPETGLTYQKGNLRINRRDVEGGNRQSDLRHTSYRAVIGAKGDLDSAWSYDIYGQYGTSIYAQAYKNEMSARRLFNALDVVAINPAGDLNDPNNWQCRSATARGEGCLPYNIFANGGVDPAALPYLVVTGFQTGSTVEKIASGSLSGQLGEYGVQLPWANDGVGIAFGAEYRSESLELNVDEEFRTGDLTGQGGPTLAVAGSFNVKEMFAEALIPIAQGQTGIEDLSLELGYRYSDYSTGKTSNTFKVQANYSPIPGLKARGGFNRAVRAPNVIELYQAQSVQLDGVTDPCAGPNPTASQADCAFAGVPANLYGHVDPNPAKQYNGQVGGNPNLAPEKADTWTVGLVVTPELVPGFSATIDWFSIKIADQIGTVGADTILDQCLKTHADTFCSLINRDNDGSLWLTADGSDGYIVDTNLNTGVVKTSGIDFSAAYTYKTDSYGTIKADMVGTWLDKWDNAIAGAEWSCESQYGAQCGTPYQRWRHKMRVTWNTPLDLDVSLAWRYYSKVHLDTGSNGAIKSHYRIPAQNYFDLSATYHVTEKMELRAGVNNIFDRDPPLQPADWVGAPYGSGNTAPQVYDALGRYIYFGGSVAF